MPGGVEKWWLALVRVQAQSFHDSKSGEGIVGGVEKLHRSKVRRRPVARGETLRFPEALLKHRSDSSPHADLSSVPAFPKDMVEVHNGAERDAQTGPDLATIIPQSESDFQDPLGLEQL